MDTSFLTWFFHGMGLDKFLPVVLAFVAFASALDAVLPQPAAGSHWIPLRKLVSALAFNVAHATNAEQPSIVTWLQRLVALLNTVPAIAAAQPQVQAPPARVEPTVVVPVAPAPVAPVVGPVVTTSVPVTQPAPSAADSLFAKPAVSPGVPPPVAPAQPAPAAPQG